MRLPTVLGLLLLHLTNTEGHISVVCTASSPQELGTVAFWFGTYHSFSDRVAGSGHIRRPDGVVSSARFGEKCRADIGVHLNTRARPSTADYEGSLKRGCLGVQRGGHRGMYPDSTVVCYDTETGNLANRARPVLGSGRPWHCHQGSNFLTWYMLVVPNTETGIYEVWTTNPNAVIAPGGGNFPCSLSQRRPWTFELSVPSSTGVRCATAPPEELLTGVDVSSLSTCDGSKKVILAGDACLLGCLPGYTQSGSLKCQDNGSGVGEWNPFFRCTRDNICLAPSISAGNMAAVSRDVHGVLPPCDAVTVAGVECQYTCRGREGASRGMLRCNENGQWVPGTGYDNCAWTDAPATEAPPTRAPEACEEVTDGGVVDHYVARQPPLRRCWVLSCGDREKEEGQVRWSLVDLREGSGAVITVDGAQYGEELYPPALNFSAPVELHFNPGVYGDDSRSGFVAHVTCAARSPSTAPMVPIPRPEGCSGNSNSSSGRSGTRTVPPAESSSWCAALLEQDLCAGGEGCTNPRAVLCLCGWVLGRKDVEGCEAPRAIGRWFREALGWVPRRDPLTLDVDGDGIETLGADGTVLFDMNDDGVRTGTGWPAPDDGFLVLDVDRDGAITSGRELFGDNTLLPDGSVAATGFEALAQHDGNGDGVIDAQDRVFDRLRVWQDADSDGVSSPEELRNLTGLGIVSISLSSRREVRNLEGGNQITDVGFFTVQGEGDANATQREVQTAANLFLAENKFFREFTDPLPIGPDAASLPDAPGSGAVRDLREAASQSRELRAALEEAAEVGKDGRKQAVSGVVSAWATTAGLSGFVDFAGQVEALRGRCSSSNNNNNNAAPWGDLLLERIRVLEAFNAHRYISVEETGNGTCRVAVRVGSVDVAVPTAAVPSSPGHLPVAGGQRAALLKGYEQLWRHAYSAVALQTWLWRYVEEGGEEATQPAFEEDEAGEGETAAGVSPLDFTRLEEVLLEELDKAKAEGEEGQWFEDVAELLLVEGGPMDFGWDGASFLSQALEEEEKKLDDDARFQCTVHRVAEAGVSFLTGNTTRCGGSSSSSPSDANAMMLRGLVAGSRGADTAHGTEGGERLAGLEGADVLDGCGGDDVLFGGEGDDVLLGGHGDDALVGGEGNDYLDGGHGANTLHGGNGDDTLTVHTSSTGNAFYPGPGNDVCTGSRGTDAFHFYGRYFGTDTVVGHGGGDSIVFHGGVKAEHLRLVRSGYDLLLEVVSEKNGGNTTASVRVAEYYRDRVLRIVLTRGGGAGGSSAVVLEAEEVFDKYRTASGTSGADVMVGDEVEERAFGLGGNDRISCGGGADELYGGEGDDVLEGEAGDDVLDGGKGDDQLAGGPGNDRYVFRAGDGRDVIVDQGGTRDTVVFHRSVAEGHIAFRRNGTSLILSNVMTGDTVSIGSIGTGRHFFVERVEFESSGTVLTREDLEYRYSLLVGTREADRLVGDVTDNRIYGLEGNDDIEAGEGNNTVYGGPGDDTITCGSGGGNELYGEEGNDELVSPFTGPGAVFVGGPGDDEMRGSATSADTYRYAVGDGHDIINDASSVNTIVFSIGGQASHRNLRRRLEANGDYLLTVPGSGSVRIRSGSAWVRTMRLEFEGSAQPVAVLNLRTSGITLEAGTAGPPPATPAQCRAWDVVRCVRAAACAWNPVAGACGPAVDECAADPFPCGEGQVCHDPDKGRAGDYRCACASAPTVFSHGAPAECFFDECSTAPCGTEQFCHDPDVRAHIRHDFVCSCSPRNASTRSVGAKAACGGEVLDECLATPFVCSSPSETCTDLNTWMGSTGDAVCRCPNGAPALAGGHGCPVDECVENPCGEGQVCDDVHSGYNDFICTCENDARLNAEGKPAVCWVDECSASSPPPCGEGQTCFDTNRHPTALDDFICYCDRHPTFMKYAASALCPLDECSSNPCGAGQACNDPDPYHLHLGDYVCRCHEDNNLTAVGKPAVCRIDECDSNPCGPGQECVDYYTEADSLENYVCHCAGNVKVGQPAPCPVDECLSNPCGEGQRCKDPRVVAEGDFVCTCEVNGMLAVGAAVPQCEYDECAEEQPCGPEQRCEDPDKAWDSRGNYRCTCHEGNAGTTIGAETVCPENECEEKEREGTCREPTSSIPSSSYTTPPLPALLPSCHDGSLFEPGAVAKDVCGCVWGTEGNASSCVVDECVVSNPCGADQVCKDPNTAAPHLGDARCYCADFPEVVSIGHPTVCPIDECATFSPCGSEQLCKDITFTVLNNFVCSCDGTFLANTSAIGEAARCTAPTPAPLTPAPPTPIPSTPVPAPASPCDAQPCGSDQVCFPMSETFFACACDSQFTNIVFGMPATC